MSSDFSFAELFDAKITDYIIAIFTIFIALFTWGLKNATIRLWGATDTLVKGADTTAERQLRAYVLIVKSRVDNFGAGKIPEICVTLKNCGQTPASDFKHSACTGFDEFPPSLKPPEFKRINEGSVHVLAPDMESKGIVPFKRTLQQYEIDGILEGKVALYVVGRIEYKDIFGNQRTTEYRLFANNLTDISNNGMSACNEGNNYT